ncbi:hypothetical protein ADL22_04560 [Streptomyces sp. NRRL F-4489]|uniref:hypothetical protein n=1 Tax=Streptomyces sp. NRRL F-4489 TaxID=1609095 RepID=UPI00074B2980|nr:hypothetical protein [Streptomyces sp. NRRL F-4489]KUL53058.1 hypothetical protein ADL22_04560 [Streptomyces sp. NRRL F-4489]
MALTEVDLLNAGDEGLVELFGRSPAGDVPKGPTEGTGIVRWGGGRIARPLARLVRAAVWRGKVFDPDGYLSNRMTSFDVLAIQAQVYKGPSLMDERECIVIDYSKISLAARGVRDEMRQVGEGLYLGVVWLFGIRVGWFALRVPEVDRTLPGTGEAAAGPPPR